jgi:xanthine dehydrogenase small subunit
MTAYLRPASLADALAARAAHPDWTVLAGGTDLLVAANSKPAPAGVLDIWGLDALTGITGERDGAIRIGAATTYASLLASEHIARELPLLAAAAREVGALQIQARGTLGGNLCTSSPVGDTLPCLLALDAVLELASARGRREVLYRDFLTGYRQTALAGDELVVAVRIPARPAGLRQSWRKMGTRRAQSISKVMLAATAMLGGDGRIVHVRLALGAVADRPIRAHAAEAAALGQLPADAAERARAALAGEITPIDDVRSTAAYRLAVAGNVVAGFLARLAPAAP